VLRFAADLDVLGARPVPGMPLACSITQRDTIWRTPVCLRLSSRADSALIEASRVKDPRNVFIEIAEMFAKLVIFFEA